jgi:hypothetical protein
MLFAGFDEYEFVGVVYGIFAAGVLIPGFSRHRHQRSGRSPCVYRLGGDESVTIEARR